MLHADFIHLRVHSAYSLSMGAIKTKDLVKLCERHRMPAVAVTDTGNLFGALEFATSAAEAGIQPIIGCELPIRRAGVDEASARIGRIGPMSSPDTLVLLVQDSSGYANLSKLVSKAFLESDAGEAPQVDLVALDGMSDGLIALTGGPSGAVGRLLSEGQGEAAEAMLLRLKALFPGRLYVELMRHGLPVEDRIEAALIALAYKHDLPLVATNDAYFADADFYPAHDVLLAIAEGTVMSDPNRRRLTSEHHFKSAAEMRILFADLPEACDNTLVVARRCAFMPEAQKPILPAFPCQSGRSEAEELRAMAAEGLEQRFGAAVFKREMSAAEREGAAKPYRDRLAYELDVIVKMGFAGYFLIVADFIQWAKRQGIPVGPGRGSGAGSVVAWSLTITDLDPLRFGLLFERFLNPERISMPDFDVDFCQDRRDEVIRYVQEKYGADRVAQIITFGKLQARAVLRDVGRVLEMPYSQVDRICKLVPNNPANPIPLRKAIEGEPQLQAMRDGDEAVKRLMEIALRLEGLYRNASTHAAGVVIGDRPLDELVPLYRDPRSSMPATQFNLKYVELAGLVKFDFLGLKTLTVLQHAVELLKARCVELDLAHIPLDDARTYEMLGHGDTVGVFQLEGQGMRDTLRKLRPNRFEDIIALVALYRPGPMDDIPKYINVKQGHEERDYLHPMLKEILEETYGIIVYQEQVLQIAQKLSGFSLGKADLLRRAMGKKIKSEMDAQRAAFIDGAMARGVPEAQATMIFEKVEKFAGYGFNKCHSAPYAMVAYQTAYLKANHPVEFLAASMTLDLGNTDKLNTFRQECERIGIKLLPPDIIRSGAEFAVEDTAEGPAIRYALAAVKGVGAQAMRAVVEERTANGPYKDLFDFARRLDLKTFNKRQFENLARAGAFDRLNANRAQTFAAAELLLRHAGSVAADRESKQVSLFGDIPETASRAALPQQADWLPMERLQQEFEAIGFYLSSHPLDAYGKSLERVGVVRSAELPARLALGGAPRFKLAGIVVGKKERTSARGNRFAFLQMSDASGFFEVTVFSEVLAQSRSLLEAGQPLLVTADARAEEESVRLTAQKIEALDGVVAQAAAGLKVFVAERDAVPPLKGLISRESGGKGRVTVVVPLPPTREVEITLPGGFRISPRVRAAVKSLPGILEVMDI
ncbi:MAG TPA: DNA polymerase III subunit alpha [Stellaceae bacterium]|nr:DNA polymerase III subunit alpha [Stellaceae bacterium]